MKLNEELQLVEEAKGNLAAFNKLYEFYLIKIYAYCLNRVASPQIAEDITSQVFLAAVEKLQKFDTEKRVRFGSWLYKVAHNKVVDYYRRNKFEAQLDEDRQLRSDEKTESAAENAQLQAQISEVLLLIKPRYQEVIAYKFYSELDNPEIATVMKMSVNNLNVLLHRALKAFKGKYLERFPDSEIYELI